MHRSQAAVTIAAILAAAGLAQALAPSDEDIRAKADAFQEWQQSGDEEHTSPDAKADELLQDVDIDELSAPQIAMLFDVIMARRGTAGAARDRLAALKDDDSRDGAIAHVLDTTIEMYSRRRPPDADHTRTLLQHPGLPDAVKSGHVPHLFTIIQYMRPEDIRALGDDLALATNALEGDIPPETVLSAVGLYMGIRKGLGDADRTRVTPDMPDDVAEAARRRDETREQIRTAVVRALKHAAQSEAAAEDPELARVLASAIALTDGAHARGQLIGHEAPEIEFAWTSPGFDAQRLSDLRGNVVVIDCWATWCGPCIAAFPKLRRIHEHYDGYNVVILGLTDIQGRHVGGGRHVDTRDNPGLEHELMGEYIVEQNMTWPVAFAESRNTMFEYGVEAIPNVFLVEPDGTVREGGLNPLAMPEEELIARIDAILRDHGLPTP